MKLITNFQGKGLQQGDKFLQDYSINNPNEIPQLLQWISKHQNNGHFVMGYFSYESIQAFEETYKVKKSDFPLASFFAFQELKPFSLKSKPYIFNWQKEINSEKYLSSIEKILKYIYEGDIYQVNYSFRQFTKIKNINWEAFFVSLVEKQNVPYASLIIDEKRETIILSLSPELFLSRQDNKLISQPMKGTIKRGKYLAEDLNQKQTLANDSKSQAENIMIVDLMRNDFSKICQLNSVKIKNKFEIKTFHTLHQMITTVEGQLNDKSIFDILKACFPAGSITGAPKKRAIEIIDEMENSPRRVYTGSIGLFLPYGDFILSVAIRTMLYYKNQLELGLGSGIVANSTPTVEWQECLLKSNFLNSKIDYNYLFETILYKKKYINLPLHIERLKKSALYFQHKFDEQAIISQLNAYKTNLSSPTRVRLQFYKNGSIELHSATTSTTWNRDIVKIKVSNQKVNSQDILLYHKTDKRDLYINELKLAQEEDYDEIIFFNEKGFLTEGSVSNIFVKNNEKWSTPAIENGLLAGTMRSQLLKKLNAKESNINKEQLKSAQQIMICNSIRQYANATIKL